MIEISVVIPVFNSEKNLFELCKQLKDALNDFKFEVILVNDNSRDNSWEVIKKLHKTYSNIVGINLRKNSGQDNAIFAGLHFTKGNFVVIMDDDLQHSPYDIPKLYAQIKKGYDVCYANFTKKQQALWKNLGSWLNGKIAEIIIEKPKNIYLSPFKILKKEIVTEILKTNYLYPYIDGIIFTITENITQISVKHYKRFQGIGNYNLLKSFSITLRLITGFSIIPLRFATILGFASAFLSFLYAIYVLISYLTSNIKIPGWASLITVNLFFSGVILISLGLLGEYIGRIYLNVNKMSKYNFKEILYY